MGAVAASEGQLVTGGADYIINRSSFCIIRRHGHVQLRVEFACHMTKRGGPDCGTGVLFSKKTRANRILPCTDVQSGLCREMYEMALLKTREFMRDGEADQSV